MKKVLLFLVTLLITAAAWAQVPQQISYQSVIRDGNNKVIASSTVGIKISLLQGSATGSAVYVETHRKTTNANGLVSLEIGTGTVLSGSFASINWASGPYLIKTETDPTGGTNYGIPGVAPLNSVPYALYAANGTPGPKGDKGDTGMTGPAGPAGPSGATGIISGANGGTGVANLDKTITLGGNLTTSGAYSTTLTSTGTTSVTLPTTGSLATLAGTETLSNKTLASPTFTGIPTAPTANAGTSTKQVATTEFVASAVSSLSVPYSGATAAVNLGDYDLKVNGITVGKGLSSMSSNTALGNGTLATNTTGNYNTANGYQSLYSNTTGVENTAIGVNSLRSNTGGNNNTANGKESLYSNTTGDYNTAIGVNSLGSNTTGRNNTANGVNSLYKNTTGYENTAIGNSALASNTTGNENTVIGTASFLNNTTGNKNTANGFGAGRFIADGNTSNTTSDFSVYLGSDTRASADNAQNEIVIGHNAIGSGSNTVRLGNTSITDVKTSGAITAAAYKIPGGTSAQYLRADGTVTTSVTAGIPYSGATAAVDLGAFDMKVNGITIGIGSGNSSSTTNLIVGNDALKNNTSGSNNIGIGSNVMKESTEGSWNTAIGFQALTKNNGTGSFVANGGITWKNSSGNTAIGNNALFNNTNGSFNTSIGHETLRQNTTSINNVAVGAGALKSVTTNGDNTAVGAYSLEQNVAWGNTAIGTHSSRNNTTGAGNTAVGNNALQSNSTGGYNTANGFYALYSNTTGVENTAIGVNSLRSNTEGNNNTANGKESLYSNTTGDYNTAIGVNSLGSNTEGRNNTANGVNSLYRNITGYENTAIGNSALAYNTTGNENTAIGTASFLNNTTGNKNTANGFGAGRFIADGSTSNTTSDYSVYLGSDTRASADNAQNEIVIGYYAIGKGSNTTVIGNSSTTNAEIKGTLKSNGQILALTRIGSNYTALISDEIIICDASNAPITITLPTAVGKTGQTYTIKRIYGGSNIVTIATTSNQTIDGSTFIGLDNQNPILKVISDGSNWWDIGNN